jgi:hypothetical protein
LAFQGLAGANHLPLQFMKIPVSLFLAWKPVAVLTSLHITLDLFTLDLFIKVASIEVAGE